MKAKTVSSIFDFPSSRDGLGVRTLLPFFFLPSPISAACKVALRRLHSVLHLIIELLSSLPPSPSPSLPSSLSPFHSSLQNLGWGGLLERAARSLLRRSYNRAERFLGRTIQSRHGQLDLSYPDTRHDTGKSLRLSGGMDGMAPQDPHPQK